MWPFARSRHFFTHVLESAEPELSLLHRAGAAGKTHNDATVIG
jgi:hypothetical protein